MTPDPKPGMPRGETCPTCRLSRWEAKQVEGFMDTAASRLADAEQERDRLREQRKAITNVLRAAKYSVEGASWLGDQGEDDDDIASLTDSVRYVVEQRDLSSDAEDVAVARAEKTENALWPAYLAGWGQSGEGFNDEWVSDRYRPVEKLHARLRRSFDKWIAGEPDDDE